MTKHQRGGDVAAAEPAEGRRRATMNDVALEAGVSQTTVSLVLNEVNSARFSADTRKRVLEAAARLGYRTTRRRGASRGGSEGLIAFVVDEISTDPWMALAMDGIREKAWERGLTVAAVATRGNGEAEQAFFRQLLRDDAIGLIYGTINTRRVEPPAPPRALPTVLLNCYVADNSLPAVMPNEVLGGLTATQRLIDAGHKRIGYINGEPWMDASRDRLRGYRRALAGADIAFDAALVRNGNWEPTAGYAGTQALMQLAVPPTAIFCANDMMALGCYEALGELGRRIPEDVAVIGYDDREVARHLRPPLTTIVLPHYAMGIDAAECLFDVAAGHTVQPRIKVEGQLVDRRSV
jgi:LacI family transcriptional regulator